MSATRSGCRVLRDRTPPGGNWGGLVGECEVTRCSVPCAKQDTLDWPTCAAREEKKGSCCDTRLRHFVACADRCNVV